MTVPTRQRTHLLAGPSLSGGSCGSISGDRGRVGHAGHRRGDRAVASRREDRGRGRHWLQESGARRRTPSSGPQGRRPIPSLRAPVRTNTSWGRGARIAPSLNRLRQNERRGGGAVSRPGPPGSSERTYAGNSGKLDRAPVSIPPSPSSASWTGSRYAARSLRPGGVPRRRAGRAIESSRAGGATPRPGSPRRSTAGRGHPPAPDLVAQPWSPPVWPRSLSRREAPRTTPAASNRGSTHTVAAPSWRSSSTSAAARSRTRRCPFPQGGDWTTERLWRKLENNENIACAICLVSRYGGLIRGSRACAIHHSVAKESKAAGYASRNRRGKLSNPPPAGARGPRPRRRSRRRTPRGLPGASRLSQIIPPILGLRLAARFGPVADRLGGLATSSACSSGARSTTSAAAETVPSPRSLAALRSGVPSFETLSAMPPSRDAIF